MEEFRKNKVLIIASAIILVIIIIFLIVVTPIINHHLEVVKIKNQIEEVQLKIELNKEQWNVCHENMNTWHTENEENRVILNDLMNQYNEMVGFTQAWH